MNEKGETFKKEKKKKKKERKGEERKHFGRRNRKERKGNILQRRRKERKIRKEEKACRGSCSDAAGYGELSFHYSRGLAYRGIIGGIACGAQVNGGGLMLIAIQLHRWYLRHWSNMPR